MQPRHQVTRAAIDLIKAFEGYRRKAARLADGRWTIGYGHTLTAREGAEVSERDAEALLTYDLIAVAHAVNDQTYTPLTQNQFDALCAFAFNIGLEKFRVASVLRLVNQGQLLQAACAMELWRKADFQGERMVIDALVRRRAAEKALFLTPTAGWVPAPSPILPPNLDNDVFGATPRDKPAVVTVSMDGVDALAEREAQPFSDGLTATQRAAAAVTSRLQNIFPDTPEATLGPTTPSDAVRPTGMPEPQRGAAAVLDPIGDRPPLPPPAWPLAFGNDVAPFVTHVPTDQLAEPEPEPVPVIELPPLPVAANEQDGADFDPKGLDRAIAREETLAGVAEWPAELPLTVPSASAKAEAAPSVLDQTLVMPEAKPEPRELGPLIGLGLLGLVFFLGGLAWSGVARDGSGPFNPWVVGTLACLAGVGFMAVAVYFLLLRLGRLEPSAEGQ